MINERMSDLLKKIWWKLYLLVCFIYVFYFKITSYSLIPSFLMSDVSKSLRSLTKNEQCEQIAEVTHKNEQFEQFEQITQVAHHKWATMIDSLTKNERIACFFEQITHSIIILKFFAKNEQFTQKTDEQIPNPGEHHTAESSSAVCIIPRSQAPQCASHSRVKMHTAESEAKILLVSGCFKRDKQEKSF